VYLYSRDQRSVKSNIWPVKHLDQTN